MVTKVFQSASDEQVSRTPLIVRYGAEYKMSFIKSVKDEEADTEKNIAAIETASTLRELEGVFTTQASKKYYQESYNGPDVPMDSIFGWGLSAAKLYPNYLHERMPVNKSVLAKI